MPTRKIVSAVFALVVIVAAIAPASGQEWPNWRGPNHDGISAETGFKTDWDTNPPVVWERELGSAFSSFACVDGKAYTCGTQDGQQVLFCLDADTGAIIWHRPFEKHYKDPNGGDGTRATPTVDDGHVYVQGAHGRLVCCSAADGQVVWDRKFNARPQWGYSGSVLIEGDLAILTGGGDDGPLVALNKKTGETVWKCGEVPAGYSTPCAFTLEGHRYVAGFLGRSVVIADVKTGREVWSMPWATDWNVNAATPIFHDGQLFLSSGYKHGSLLLKLRRQDDKLVADKVWEGKAIRAKFQTPVLYKGYLYASDEAAALKCVEFATGQIKWGPLRGKHGTVVIADGHLFVLSEEGKLLIGEASPEGFEPTTQVQILEGRCWTVPTLYRGRIYARNREKAVCLKLTP